MKSDISYRYKIEIRNIIKFLQYIFIKTIIEKSNLMIHRSFFLGYSILCVSHQIINTLQLVFDYIIYTEQVRFFFCSIAICWQGRETCKMIGIECVSLSLSPKEIAYTQYDDCRHFVLPRRTIMNYQACLSFVLFFFVYHVPNIYTILLWRVQHDKRK